MVDCLGDRMKKYEDIWRMKLPIRMPLIVRIDGKAFHNLTQDCCKPFDADIVYLMQRTMEELCKEVEGCKFAYCQSDEISLLITDYENFNTQPWFDKNLQKIVSITASIATAKFNSGIVFLKKCAIMRSNKLEKDVYFDSRAFVLPKEEVCNYFIWRQQDATRNAIQMLGQANFSHNKLQNLSSNQIQDLLFLEKGINFNNLGTHLKRGSCCYYEKSDIAFFSGWVFDDIIPIFTENRNYIERFL